MGRGQTKFSNFFYYVKKKFVCHRGGYGQFGQGVNTPLCDPESLLLAINLAVFEESNSDLWKFIRFNTTNLINQPTGNWVIMV